MEIPKPGVESALQLGPMPQPWQRQILNPLSQARDQTCNLMFPSWIRLCCATTGTPVIYYFKIIHLCPSSQSRNLFVVITVIWDPGLVSSLLLTSWVVWVTHFISLGLIYFYLQSAQMASMSDVLCPLEGLLFNSKHLVSWNIWLFQSLSSVLIRDSNPSNISLEELLLFIFLGLHIRHMEVPRLEVESNL